MGCHDWPWKETAGEIMFAFVCFFRFSQSVRVNFCVCVCTGCVDNANFEGVRVYLTVLVRASPFASLYVCVVACVRNYLLLFVSLSPAGWMRVVDATAISRGTLFKHEI